MSQDIAIDGVLKVCYSTPTEREGGMGGKVSGSVVRRGWTAKTVEVPSLELTSSQKILKTKGSL